MKKSIFLIVLVLILSVFSACEKSETSDVSSNSEISKENVSFTASYIRTNGHSKEVEYPKTYIIRSKDELDNYYNKFKTSYFLERREEIYLDNTIGFLDACDKYDDAYFENQILVMVLLEEGSGSIRHEADKIEISSAGKLYVNIKRLIPEIGTDDMAQWHVLLEMGKDADVTSENDVIVSFEEACLEEKSGWLEAEKPVIYLYPEKETEVSVKLTLSGEFTCTYPKYENGWNVTAYPDGTLKDKNGQTYNYLYWEGKDSTQYDFSKGFCVKGEETAEFLEKVLSDLGLNRKEANEFIVYWLPLMEENPYNIISFQSDVYTQSAKLDITPAPDTLIRVFMAWRKSDVFVEIPNQKLYAPHRSGFTVIEWGGSEVK